MTLPARLRAHEPSAIREVYDAIVASRGVLAEVGRLLGCRGNASAAAGRLVAIAGLGEQLAAVQQEHGTGQRGRPVKRRGPLTIALSAEAFGLGSVLSPEAKARCVDAGGMTTALLLVDEDGRIAGQLVREV